MTLDELVAKLRQTELITLQRFAAYRVAVESMENMATEEWAQMLMDGVLPYKDAAREELIDELCRPCVMANDDDQDLQQTIDLINEQFDESIKE